MCTVTWRAAGEGGHDLFFNRDELNTRGAEVAPCAEQAGGVVFAAPRDGDRGGTWLVANAHGVTVALLNDYACAWRPAAVGAVSRGALVLGCAGAATAAEVLRGIDRGTLGRTGAFKLVVLEAGGRVMRLEWDGRALMERTGEALCFETSSSWDTARVCAARRRRFEEMVAGAGRDEGSGGGRAGRDAWEDFHWRHDAGAGAESVLMRRADARTRSVTRVSVRAGRVEMVYRAVGAEGARENAGTRVEFSRL